MKDLFKQITAAAGDKMKEAGISIPITAGMLSRLFGSSLKAEGMSEVRIQFGDEEIRVTGTAKKLLLRIPFEIDLVPLKAESRILYFEIRRMEPLNHEWIKKKIFTKPPLACYDANILALHLNGFDKIDSIPVGRIQDFQLKNKKLWLKIGL